MKMEETLYIRHLKYQLRKAEHRYDVSRQINFVLTVACVTMLAILLIVTGPAV